ncbi:helix-turn-helix domain-containing protein [Streptomyces sp. NPDC088789]|uniref:helix-turn-helix domain-containing protein n=1 Tax=Streptomyces sp. NPDC088789 TaxID=3365899 RepID=UPI00381E780A
MSWADATGADRIAHLAGLLDTCQVGTHRADFTSWGFYPPVIWRNYWHRHSYYEVCLVHSGAGRFSTRGQDHEVVTGDVFLARPGDVHEIESSASDPLGIAYWGFTLRTGCDGPRPDERGWWSGLTDTSRPVVSARSGSLAALVATLAANTAPVQSGTEAVLGGLGAALVVDTARAFAAEEDLEREVPEPKERSVRLVAQMQRHLMDNLSRPVTVRNVAADVHLSERHAERLFLEHTGTSMMATLRRMRLELAATLLLDTSTKVSAVARSCGYPDARAFSTAFRRANGRSPLEFRAYGGTLHLDSVEQG